MEKCMGAYDKEVKLRSIQKWLENFIMCGIFGPFWTTDTGGSNDKLGLG